MKKTNINRTVDQSEIEKFEKMAHEWWDINGSFRPLHRMNPVRINYIKDAISKFKISLSEAKILDVGCGGGLISLPLAKLCKNVTAIDASSKNIEIAKIQAKKESAKLKLLNATTSEMLKKRTKYDVIISLEVIEHVADYKAFLEELTILTHQDSIIIISTINRSFKSLLQAKMFAEYVARMLPIGTHDFDKFLKPKEIQDTMATLGWKMLDIAGVKMKLDGSWYMSNDTGVNYIATFKRKK
ncbi:MAG: bifunctional 2-polyprenyl-6-hydroxyphenol methylase/3-demethylubiquinol 3-O-methyltransferase UbiG [Alphaproteobacteria bacterium]